MKKIGPGQTIAKGTGDGSAMPLGGETDRISNLAYWAYLVLGLGALIPVVILFFSKILPWKDSFGPTLGFMCW